MAIRIKFAGTDPDTLFAARLGTATHANTRVSVGGADLSDRYHISTGSDQIGFNTRLAVGGSDIKTFFRSASFTLTASITGPSSVASGGGGGGTWNLSATSSVGLAWIRFQVTGHGTGATTPASGGSYASSINWGTPFGFPNFASTSGTYDFVFDCQDSLGNTANQHLSVTVL